MRLLVCIVMVVGGWLLVVGSWLLVVGYHVSRITHHSSRFPSFLYFLSLDASGGSCRIGSIK